MQLAKHLLEEKLQVVGDVTRIAEETLLRVQPECKLELWLSSNTGDASLKITSLSLFASSDSATRC